MWRALRGRLTWGVASVAVLSAGVLGSCSAQTVIPSVGIFGPHSLVTVKDLLFITSTDRSELRVLNLVPEKLSRDDERATSLQFVRAPNVLEPLSIPVVDRATALARDVRYTSEGITRTGPYVYARSEGGLEFSVVGPLTVEEPLKLVELKRLQEAAPVTAIAGQGGVDDASSSVVFVATFDGTRAELRRRVLPPLGQMGNATAESLASSSVAVLANEAIVSMEMMPGADGRLLVSTRATGGTAGRTAIVDTVSGGVQELPFPAPVRKAITHGQSGDLPAGTFVYGILDEESCRDRVLPNNAYWVEDPPCRGILAVDTRTGAIAKDASGSTMLPIRFAGAAITDVIVIPNGRLAGVVGGALRLTGLFTVATGAVVAFDGLEMHLLDVAANETAGVSALNFRNADGTLATAFPGGGVFPSEDLKAAEGAAFNEVVGVTFQGLIPGLVNVSGTASDGQHLTLSAEALTARALAGDLVSVRSADGVCSGEALVASVSGLELTLVEALPGACVGGAVTATVRAAGRASPTDPDARIYVVEGATSGYMGRAKNLALFTPETTRYFFRSSSFSAASPAPQIQFRTGSGNPAMVRGDRYELSITSGFLTYSLVFDTSYDSSFQTGINFPEAIAFDPERSAAFIAYPASQGILYFWSPGVSPGVVNSTQNSNILSYR